MHVYYRSDTRAPEQIFFNGFSQEYPGVFLDALLRQRDIFTHKSKASRKPFSGLTSVNLTPLSIEARVSDVIAKHAVCMTRKFESAAMFPVEYCPITYIYVMLLPEAIPLQLKYGSEFSGPPIPQFAPNLIFDMHSLQLQQAHYLIDDYAKADMDYEPEDIAWALHAYECISSKITPNYIMAAVKIEREKLNNPFSSKIETLLTQLGNNTAVRFSIKEIRHNPSYQIIDMALFQETLQDLETKYKQSKIENGLQTPSFSYGLGGTLLPISY